LGFWGLGFGVWGLGFGVQGSGLKGLRLTVDGLQCRSLGYKSQGV